MSLFADDLYPSQAFPSSIPQLMTLFANILGFSAFGLAARMGQLGIQRRNILDNPGGHLISMAVFGYAGYWAYHWDQRAAELLAQKRQEILEHRQNQVGRGEKQMAAALGLEESD